MTRRSILGPVLVMLAVACGSGDEASTTTSGIGDDSTTITIESTSTSVDVTTTTGGATTTTVASTTPSTLPPTTMGDGTGSLPDVAVDAAHEVAAAELDLARDEVSIVSVEAMTWSDAAMGCPEPDTAYAQALTSGFVVTLQGGGEAIELHVAQDGSAIVTCPDAG